MNPDQWNLLVITVIYDAMVELKEMDTVGRIQTLEEAVCISHRNNIPRKGIFSIIFLSAMG